VLTVQVDSAVYATTDSAVMVLHAPMLTSARLAATTATPKPNVKIVKVPSTANVAPVLLDSSTSKVMVINAKMLMNANQANITVTPKPPVPTLMVHLTATAKLVSKVTVSNVKMLTNAQLEPTTVTPTPPVTTLSVHSHANVEPQPRTSRTSKVTAEPVPMLMNAQPKLPDAVKTQSAPILLVASNAHAKTALLVKTVLMLMNVMKEHMTVTKTPPVSTLMALSCANVEMPETTLKISMVMERHVRTATNAKPRPIPVTETQTALILMAVLLASAKRDSAVMDSAVKKQPPPHLPDQPLPKRRLHQRAPHWPAHVNHEAPTTATTRQHVLITKMEHSPAHAKLDLSVMELLVKNHQNRPLVDQQQQGEASKVPNSHLLNKPMSRLICKTSEVLRTKCSPLLTELWKAEAVKFKLSLLV
jgi:hypothetical protein